MKPETATVERRIVIAAAPAVVFRFFTDSGLFAAWWGKGSSIEPRVGGKVSVVYPNGLTAGGVVEAIEAPSRVVFSWGYSSERAIPPGSSRVEVLLRETRAGTELRLIHSGIPLGLEADQQQGWRYQLSLFSQAACAVALADAASRIDEWFAAWSSDDASERERLVAACCEDELEFRDAHSCLSGRDDVLKQLEAVRRFMPGTRIAREGDVALCHHAAQVAWAMRGPDGGVMARGRNFCEFAPTGRIARLFGFWG